MRLRKAVEAMAVVTVVDTDTVGVITAAVMEVGIFMAAAISVRVKGQFGSHGGTKHCGSGKFDCGSGGHCSPRARSGAQM